MLGLVVALIAILVLACAGLAYERRGERRDAVRLPPPGRLVDIGDGRRLHIHVTGAGAPTVVLESGIAATSLSWALVQPQVAQFSTVCSYDRGGLGWSGVTNAARTPSAIARELRTLLRNAHLPAPYIVVGHSFGGLVAQRFADLYRDEVVGLVLVDSLAASEWYPFRDRQKKIWERGIRLSRRGAILARFGVVRACLSMLIGGGRFAPRLAGRLASGRGGSGFMDRMAGQIRKLPQEVWPVIAAHWCNPRSFDTMARHLESLPESASEMCALEVLDVSATVITGGKNPGAARDAAPLLPNAKRIVAEHSGHWVQLDEPSLVIEAIRELVEKARHDSI
jgi:pimeloyl-ACP methyl ester carboxylesterase